MAVSILRIAVLALALLPVVAFAQTAADCNAAGVEYYNAKRYSEAIDSFLDAYNLEPDNATVRRNLCSAYQGAANDFAKAGGVTNLEQAAGLLETAIGVDPQNHSPLVQLGAYYLKLDYIQEAIYRLEDALGLSPGHSDAHELLGDAYYRNNQLPEAIARWEKALTLDPSRKHIDKKLDKARRESTIEGDFHTTESRNFSISFEANSKTREVGVVRGILERARIDIGRNFGGTFPPPPIYVVLYTAEDFASATLLGSHVGALFDGKIRVPHMLANGELLSEAELRRRLYHEYTHEVVDFIASDRVPWWLHEGLAEQFSTEMTSEKLRYIHAAFASRTSPALTQMESSQLEALTVEQLNGAYLKSHAAVWYLSKRFGPSLLNVLMRNLSEGQEIEAAMAAVYRRSYAQLEKEIAREVAQAIQ